MENIINEILKKEKIKFGKITKSTSGFTNLVYFVDDKYVIKISNSELAKKRLNNEISVYKNVKLSCMPKFIASGDFDDYKYLIVSKLKGKCLYSVWHTLPRAERRNCVEQIAKILMKFHKKKYKFLDQEYKDLDWVEFMSNQLRGKAAVLKNMGLDVKYLNNFISNELPSLFGKNTFGLVYNDAHFDNFIYNNGKLGIIDFDRVRACPIDYEMLIFKTMCDNPLKFASKEDERFVRDEDYKQVYAQFKDVYKNMFKDENIVRRISVYQFNYLIGQAINLNDKIWAEKLLKKFI